jgi:hypothetical protein
MSTALWACYLKLKGRLVVGVARRIVAPVVLVTKRAASLKLGAYVVIVLRKYGVK